MTTRSARPNWLFRLFWNITVLLCITSLYFGITDLGKSFAGADEAFQLAVAAAGSESLFEFAGLLGWSKILLSLASMVGLWGIYQQKKKGAYLFLGCQIVMIVVPLLVLGADNHFLYSVGLTGASLFFMGLIFIWAAPSFHTKAASQQIDLAN
jgi:hypothetical protein